MTKTLTLSTPGLLKNLQITIQSKAFMVQILNASPEYVPIDSYKENS